MCVYDAYRIRKQQTIKSFPQEIKKKCIHNKYNKKPNKAHIIEKQFDLSNKCGTIKNFLYTTEEKDLLCI